MSLTFDQLREANAKRCEEVYHDIQEWSETDWACATAGEVGEMCNLIKKRRRGEPIRGKEVADEMADVVCYLDLLAARMSIDLGKAVARKFNAVSDRHKCDIKL